MDEASKEILARLDEMSKGDSRRENKIDNIQREMSKLKKENEELRKENWIIRKAATQPRTTYENRVAGKGGKEKKCSLAGCREGKERKRKTARG